MTKLRYLIAIVLVLVQTSVQSAGETMTARIQLPAQVSLNYTDLTVDLYARNGHKQGDSLKVSADLTVTYPTSDSIGMLQVRQKSPKANKSSTLVLVTGIYFRQQEVGISALTTVRALFAKEIQDIYSTINDADKPRAESIIVALLKQETSGLEQFMRTDGYSIEKFARQLVQEAAFKTKAEQLNAALVAAIESGALGVRAKSPIAEVRKSLEALISCQSNPMTYGADPAEEQRLQRLLHDEFKRSGDGAVLRRKIDLFGAAVTQIFPGSLGTSPAFAAILKADMKTLRASVHATGIDLSQCTTQTCEIKINEKATMLMVDSALITGQVSKIQPSTLLGCIYQYVR